MPDIFSSGNSRQSTGAGKPIAAINYFSSACDYNLTIVSPVITVAPVNFRAATGHDNIYAPFGFTFDHRSDGRGAGTRARSLRLADATLPDAQLDCISILNPDEHYVRAIRELFVVFNSLTDSAPIKRVKVVNENTTVWVSHLQGSNWKRLAGDIEFIVDYFLQRLFRNHRNGGGVKLWLAQLRIKHVAARTWDRGRLARTAGCVNRLSKSIQLDARAGAQSQLFRCPKFFVIEISR